MPRTRGSFYWARDPTLIGTDLEAWVEVNIYSRAEKRAQGFANEITSWMQQNAPWEDITGAARENLGVTVEKQGHTLSLVMAHGVEYGVWLELMQSGRFSILPQTVALFAPQITDRLLKR